MVNDGLDDEPTAAIARRIREELARRRISRQALADIARISVSTLEKALAGRRSFTFSTVIRLEEALGTSLRETPVPAGPPPPTALPQAQPQQAPMELGAYTRKAVSWLEGSYLTLRPSFKDNAGVYSYRTTIEWDTERSHLVFAETERVDSSFAQRGAVSLPSISGHIYLVTNKDGQYRLAMLGRPTVDGSLYGVLTTLVIGHGSQLGPAASPLALLRLEKQAEPAFGSIDPGHAAYSRYRAAIDGVTHGDFARFPQ